MISVFSHIKNNNTFLREIQAQVNTRTPQNKPHKNLPLSISSFIFMQHACVHACLLSSHLAHVCILLEPLQPALVILLGQMVVDM